MVNSMHLFYISTFEDIIVETICCTSSMASLWQIYVGRGQEIFFDIFSTVCYFCLFFFFLFVNLFRNKLDVTCQHACEVHRSWSALWESLSWFSLHAKMSPNCATSGALLAWIVGSDDSARVATQVEIIAPWKFWRTHLSPNGRPGTRVWCQVNDQAGVKLINASTIKRRMLHRHG